MDEDTTDAAEFQQQLEERSRREAECLKHTRKQCSGFRAEIDEFHAAFTLTLKRIRNHHDKHQ